MPEFKDIASAPRDGSRIAALRFCGRLPPSIAFVQWQECGQVEAGGYWTDAEGKMVWLECRHTGPTHWSEPEPFDYGVVRATRLH